MTTQTKKFIELLDLLGLRFQCNECGASLFLPLNQSVNATRLRSCPHCNHPWLSVSIGTAGATSIESSVSDFVDAAKRLASNFKGGSGFPVGCSLAIEVTSESPSPVSAGDLPATHN
jgi:DNA-directed RNA polymerase subunit RPC12/RpoP